MAPGRIPREGGASHGLQTGLTHPGQVQGLGCVRTETPTGLSNLPQGRARSREPLWDHVFFDPEPDAVLPQGLEPGWMSGGEDRGAWGKTSGHPGTRSAALGSPPFPTLLLLLTRSWQTTVGQPVGFI